MTYENAIVRIKELEAALKPFAAAYERLLGYAPAPDVALIPGHSTTEEFHRIDLRRPPIVRWSDLYRAANLLRETPHA